MTKLEIKVTKTGVKIFSGIIKFLTVYLWLGILTAFGGIFAFHIFQDPNYDSTPITTVGAGVLIALASVTFSWTNTFQPTAENESTRNMLRGLGERMLYSAITFILATVLKFFESKKTLAFPKSTSFLSAAFYCVHLLYGILFMTAMFLTAMSFYWMLDFIYARI